MITIYTDGGSRGNPGKSACAFVIVKDNEIGYQESKFLGIKTNNEAEYHAIILALTHVSKSHEKEIELKSDSELVIKQLNGHYKINKPHLLELNLQVKELIEKHNLKIEFSNLKRDDKFISQADFLVNQELDSN